MTPAGRVRWQPIAAGFGGTNEPYQLPEKESEVLEVHPGGAWVENVDCVVFRPSRPERLIWRGETGRRQRLSNV